jgi:hypothetical protein
MLENMRNNPVVLKEKSNKRMINRGISQSADREFYNDILFSRIISSDLFLNFIRTNSK